MPRGLPEHFFAIIVQPGQTIGTQIDLVLSCLTPPVLSNMSPMKLTSTYGNRPRLNAWLHHLNGRWQASITTPEGTELWVSQDADKPSPVIDEAMQYADRELGALLVWRDAISTIQHTEAA